MYSKLPPEEEWLSYSKHVEDIYWNKFKMKVLLVGSYYVNSSRCTVHVMSNLLSFIVYRYFFIIQVHRNTRVTGV